MRMSLLFLALLGLAPLAVAQEASAPVPMPAASMVQSCPLSALAYLPQDCEAYVAIGNAGEAAGRLAKLPEELHEAADVESCAVGLSAGSEAALRSALPVLHLAETHQTDESLASLWTEAAHEVPARILSEQYAQHAAEDIDQAISALEHWHPAPLYAVVTFRAEAADKAGELQRRLTEELRRSQRGESIAQGEWQGVRLHVSPDMADNPSLSLLQKARLRAALEHFSLCVVSTVREHSLIVCVCADPTEAQPACSPVSSVLAADSAVFVHAAPHAPLAAGYMTPALLNLRRDAHLQTMRSLAGFATGVFKTLSVEDAPAAAVYQGAVNAVTALQEQTEKSCPAVDAPAQFLVWEEEGRVLRVAATYDACGTRYRAAEGCALPTDAETILTLESDPTENPNRPDVRAVLRACEALAEGAAETLDNERREQAQHALMQYRFFAEEQAALGKAAETCAEALTGKWVLVADGKGQVPAALLGGSPAHMVIIPRVALRVGVRDVRLLETAGAQGLSAVEQGLAKLGVEAPPWQDIPLTHTQEGAVTLHSLALPMCCPAFSPSAVVAEHALVLGSSAELSLQLAQAPLRSAAGEGCTSFRFRAPALASLLQRMAAEDVRMQESAAQAALFASLISEVSGRLTTTAADDLLHLNLEIRFQP